MQSSRVERLYGPLAVLGGRTLRFLLLDLPLMLLVPTLPFLLVAGLVWSIVAPPEQPANSVAAALLFGCYGLAGLSWGLRRAVVGSVEGSEEAFEQSAARLTDLLLQRVLACTTTAPRFEVAALRRQCERTFRPLSGSGGWIVAAPADWLLGRALRSRARLLDDFLDSLEERGETHVSADSLGMYVRDEFVGLTMQSLRRRAAVASVCGHLLTIAFACVPLLAVWAYGLGR